MFTLRYRVASMALVLLAAVALVSAQITFSRDWKGGKRSVAQPQLAIDCGQFTRLCRHFVHELKQAMSSDMSAKRHRGDPESWGVTPMYDDDK